MKLEYIFVLRRPAFWKRVHSTKIGTADVFNTPTAFYERCNKKDWKRRPQLQRCSNIDLDTCPILTLYYVTAWTSHLENTATMQSLTIKGFYEMSLTCYVPGLLSSVGVQTWSCWKRSELHVNSPVLHPTPLPTVSTRDYPDTSMVAPPILF